MTRNTPVGGTTAPERVQGVSNYREESPDALFCFESGRAHRHAASPLLRGWRADGNVTNVTTSIVHEVHAR